MEHVALRQIIVGRASEQVRCEARYRPLLERLIGTVVMVEDRAAAARLAAAHPALRFVSLDGEVWETGQVRAGSAGRRGSVMRKVAPRIGAIAKYWNRMPSARASM